MTCIVGITNGKKVWIGGDSAGSDGHQINLRKDEKVFEKNGFVFGFTSSFRMGQLLKYKLVVKKPRNSRNLEEFMATKFIDAVRSCLKDGGYTHISNNQEYGGVFLVGVYGRLFTIDSDFQVAENYDNYVACGSGEQFALGSLYSTQYTDLNEEQRIIMAIKSAAHHSTGVRMPEVIQSI